MALSYRSRHAFLQPSSQCTIMQSSMLLSMQIFLFYKQKRVVFQKPVFITFVYEFSSKISRRIKQDK